MVGYTLEIPEETITEIKKRIIKAFTKTGFQIEAEAKKLCPVDTGKLRSSIYTNIEDNKVTVGAPLKYAKNVEFGTPPHTIKPKNKKALAWKGAKHPVKSVKHPGTRPQPFLRPAVHRGLTQYLLKNIKAEMK